MYRITKTFFLVTIVCLQSCVVLPTEPKPSFSWNIKDCIAAGCGLVSLTAGFITAKTMKAKVTHLRTSETAAQMKAILADVYKNALKEYPSNDTSATKSAAEQLKLKIEQGKYHTFSGDFFGQISKVKIDTALVREARYFVYSPMPNDDMKEWQKSIQARFAEQIDGNIDEFEKQQKAYATTLQRSSTIGILAGTATAGLLMESPNKEAFFLCAANIMSKCPNKETISLWGSRMRSKLPTQHVATWCTSVWNKVPAKQTTVAWFSPVLSRLPSKEATHAWCSSTWNQGSHAVRDVYSKIRYVEKNK